MSAVTNAHSLRKVDEEIISSVRPLVRVSVNVVCSDVVMETAVLGTGILRSLYLTLPNTEK